MIRWFAFLVAAAAILVPSPSGAGTTEVTVGDAFFSPDTISIDVGRGVRWSRDRAATDRHNVRQRRLLFYSGPESADPDWSFARVFSAGRFPYNCQIHPVQMVGRVDVHPLFEARPDGLTFTVRWATADTNTGRAFDVRYRIDGGSWRVWKSDATSFRAVFGKDAHPFRVRRGHEYGFQVRSQRRVDSPRRVSGWSPELTVQT